MKKAFRLLLYERFVTEKSRRVLVRAVSKRGRLCRGTEKEE